MPVRALAAVFLALLASQVKAQPIETRAERAYMIEAETGTVLLAKNADALFPPASIAKLMTMEVVFDALESGMVSLDDGFYISEHAWRTGGAVSGTATMFAEVTSTVPLEALIRGAIIQSANDACIAIAEGMAGSEEAFARRMTERARTLGLERSTFVNPTGLPAQGERVTAREMTLLARHIWREYPEYYGYFSEPDFEWNGIRQRNRNPLLTMDMGADGLKTGYTEESGYAIVASVARRGRRLFLTLGGMESERERVEEARKVLDWGMRGFDKRMLFAEGEVIGQASVYGGAKAGVALRAAGPVAVLVPQTDPESLSARIVYEGPVPAPVEEGAPIGKLQIRLRGTLSREVPVYAAESVDRGRLHQRALDAVGELLIGWMRSGR